MGSHGQEYWSELSLPTSGDLPVAGMEPKSLASPALGSRFFTTVPPGKPLYTTYDLPCNHFQVYNDFEHIHMALQPSHYSAPKHFHHTKLKHSTRSTITPLVTTILLSGSMNLLIL